MGNSISSAHALWVKLPQWPHLHESKLWKFLPLAGTGFPLQDGNPIPQRQESNRDVAGPPLITCKREEMDKSSSSVLLLVLEVQHATQEPHRVESESSCRTNDSPGHDSEVKLPK